MSGIEILLGGLRFLKGNLSSQMKKKIIKTMYVYLYPELCALEGYFLGKELIV